MTYTRPIRYAYAHVRGGRTWINLDTRMLDIKQFEVLPHCPYARVGAAEARRRMSKKHLTLFRKDGIIRP